MPNESSCFRQTASLSFLQKIRLSLLSLVVCYPLSVVSTANAQLDFKQKKEFTQQDRLRGSITPERVWWDLKHYKLAFEVDPETKSLQGTNEIKFLVIEPQSRMQIDLQHPLKITKIEHGDSELKFEREGNVYWVDFTNAPEKESVQTIIVHYGGVPVESENPPWSGGVTWQKDKLGNHFIATSCQGSGASIWWPNKDHLYDEPDEGVSISITVPEDLTAVSNGRLDSQTHDQANKKKTFNWVVTNPINNYCINANIGNYVNFSDTLEGEAGTLDLDYWVLEHQREVAMKHFKEVPRTIKAFEHWFGPYPFYEDSFKMVVVPYAGMEHQSSVTYGNGFKNGYGGRDLSNTGVGLKFDFIIVHESGHEWFGNNVSMKDAADMWIHEGFTNYSENLFVEHHFSKEEGAQYVIGCRRLIKNDIPIIGVYDVNCEGSGDMYYKGGNMLHTIRQIVNDDDKWREILRGINQQFRHQCVSTEQIEDYISQESGVDFSFLFDQYLRTTQIPRLVYQTEGRKLTYRFEDVVEGFSYPVKTMINGNPKWLTVSDLDREFTLDEEITSFDIDQNWFITLDRLGVED